MAFIFVGIACVVNIVGDLLLVGVFRMDVAGAAIATVAAQLVSVIASLMVLRKQNLPISFSKKQCRVYESELRMILNVGVLIALQEAMVQVSFLVINSIVNNMGLMPSAGFFGGGLLSSLFTNDAEVIAQSADYLKGFSAECILTCILFSSIGYLSGCGKSIPVMVQGISSAFCIRIPVSIFMSKLSDTSLIF